MNDHNKFVKRKISTGTEWENQVGYSRAVRSGLIIHVAGTTAADEQGNIVGENNAYEQAKFIFDKIKGALERLGADLSDVVRTRMYVTNIEDWQRIGKAHGEYFAGIKPASTMVEVSSLIDKRMLVEIEAEAVINESGGENERD